MPRFPPPFSAWIGIALLVVCAPVQAEETRAQAWLHLNGYTYHFAAPNANDNLFGAGLTWYTHRWGRVTRAWEADAFQDSDRKLAAYAGYSWTCRMRYFNAGITAAIMYHRNFADQNRWCVLPVGLPFVELPLRHAMLRAYYIPPVRSRHDNQIAFQLLLPFGR